LDIGFEWDIWDENNSPLKKNFHFEDFNWVPECTAGDDTIFFGKYTATVIDDETNTPLGDVNVKAINTANDIIAELMTDSTGKAYFLLPEGDYTIIFSKEGYRTASCSETIVRDEHLKYDAVWMSRKGDDGTTNWDFIVPVTHLTTVPAGYVGIYTADDLDNLRNDLSGKYIVMNDIDLADFNNGEWVPIGSSDNGFKGVFDGNGYAIHNMKITESASEGVGLFCRISNAEVKNTGLTDANIDLQDESEMQAIGIICGFSDGSTTINNCFAKGKITADSPFLSSYIGGICGYNTGTSTLTITNCFNKSNISKAAHVGGILGNKFWPNTVAIISNCYNTGNITAIVYAGGIVGNARATISNCYNSGNISTSIAEQTDTYAAGIIALAGSNSKVNDSYNTGNIYAYARRYAHAAGGIAGSSTTGSSWYSSIQNFYNSGNVIAEISSEPFDNSALASAEGIHKGSGTNSMSSTSFTIHSCVVASNRIFAENVSYPLNIRSNLIGGISGIGTRNSTLALNNITGNATDDATARISIEEAKSQSTYEDIGWNFDDVWAISPSINNGYPYLRGLQP